MCLYIGTIGIMFCYQTDGPLTVEGLISRGGGACTYNRDLTVFSQSVVIFFHCTLVLKDQVGRANKLLYCIVII